MKRIPRHPYQILDISELVAGQVYVFVVRSAFSLRADKLVFGGTIGVSSNIAKTSTINAFGISSTPDITTITIHLDGWTTKDVELNGIPTIVYWGPTNLSRYLDTTYDLLETYLGPLSKPPTCPHLVVPIQRWEDDPQIYPDVVKRKVKLQSPVDVLDAASWEQKMRQKKHDAMAKMLGF